MTSAIAANQVFTSIHVVGGLLPADMLVRIADGKDISGSRPADYHVVGARSVQDDAERHWDYLKGAWRALRAALGDDGHDPAGLATENWLLPLFEEHGFGRLQRLPDGIHADDRTRAFPVPHRWEHVPVHLADWDADLDRRPAGGGLPPQSMLQECLNRSPAHLWGILANGRHLRILRDSTSLAGSSYIDIDLEAMFDGELFAEFVVLYRLLHVSRYEIPDGAAPSACRMERWRAEAIDAGIPFLNRLRDGVQDAIAHLGTGFLRHPDNGRLRDDLDTDVFKRALLRLVYRLLFWFVAEDRDVLHTPGIDEEREEPVREILLVQATARSRGTPRGHHPRRPMASRTPRSARARRRERPATAWPARPRRHLRRHRHRPDPARPGTCPTSTCSPRSNRWPASTTRLPEGTGPSTTATSAPRNSAPSTNLSLNWSRSGARKNAGFSSTSCPATSARAPVPTTRRPRSSTACSTPTLDPVLDDAQKACRDRGDRRRRRPGRRDRRARCYRSPSATQHAAPATSSSPLPGASPSASPMVREHNPEPTLEALRTALRDVVTRCVYGVDINPMAVELAKVSLWLEALEPGKPLGFLDARSSAATRWSARPRP